jgi:hypothetical protein
LRRLEENISAVAVTLNESDLKEINEAITKIEVKGARYNEQAQKMINR